MEPSKEVTVQRLRVVGPDRVAYAPGFARAVRQRLRDADIVHVHSIFTNPVHVALRESQAAAVPTVLRPCGLLHPYSLARSRWQKRAYLGLWGKMVRRACTAWHYTSENEATESWPRDASPRFVLPNGIEAAEHDLDRDEARARVARMWPALGRAPYVLFLGRLHPKKRLDLLIEAFLAGAPRDYQLAVAGPDEGALWQTVAARFLGGAEAAARVHRLGTVRGEEKVALLAGAHLFALPSEHENFGIAALEALAAGTPVMLSPHVDLAGAVTTVGFGYRVPLDSQTWTRQLRKVLAEPDRLVETGERARAWVREHYDWRRIAGELEHRYQWVMAGCPAEDCSGPQPHPPSPEAGARRELEATANDVSARREAPGCPIVPAAPK
jgi:glycosyltransferase involved in cell wall biosynthesis